MGDREVDYPVFFTGGAGKCYITSEKHICFRTDAELAEGAELEMRIMPTDEIMMINHKFCVIKVQESNAPGMPRYDIHADIVPEDLSIDGKLKDEDEKVYKHYAVIQASPKDCYDAICNFKSYPKWQKTIKSVKVLESGLDRRPKLVEFGVSIMITNLLIVNEYQYDDENFILNWNMVQDDDNKGLLKSLRGSYVFNELRQGRTNAELTFAAVLGYYVPKKIMEYVQGNTMRKSIMALKKVAEHGIPE